MATANAAEHSVDITPPALLLLDADEDSARDILPPGRDRPPR